MVQSFLKNILSVWFLILQGARGTGAVVTVFFLKSDLLRSFLVSSQFELAVS